MAASGGRPAERYWCRVCNRSGLLRNLGGNHKAPSSERHVPRPLPQRHAERPEPNPAHIAHYRTLYAATALWAHGWMLDGCHPDPQRYLHRRGLSDATIGRYLLGVTLGDPDSLVAYLRQECPEAVPYAEEAGLVVRNDTGVLHTHWNLRGRPFDHPDTQITLLFSLPVPGLPPTVIVQATQSSTSNAGREAAVKARLCAAAQQLLDQGVRVIDVDRLATVAQASVVTARKHWTHVAAPLHLRMATRRQRSVMPRGGERFYERMVLLRRGRWVPPRQERAQALTHTSLGTAPLDQDGAVAMADHARGRSLVTRPIRRGRLARRRRLTFHTVRPADPRPDRGPPITDAPPRPPPPDP